MKCTITTELEEHKSLSLHLHAMTFLNHKFVPRCYTLPPLFFFEGKLIGFNEYLAFTFLSNSMLKRERKRAYVISAAKYSSSY